MSETLPTMVAMSSPVMGRSAELEAMQREKPVWRVLTPAGDEAWLVIGYPELKKLLLDRRLGRTHPDPDNAPQYVKAPIFDMLRAMAGDGDGYAAHARLRLLLAPHFTHSRMTVLRERVLDIINATVDRMVALTPPVDLQTAFSRPVSLQVLYELIGVPADERDGVTGLLHGMGDLADADGAAASAERFVGYLAELAARKRVAPEDDVLSGVVAHDVPDTEAAMITCMLLFAGHESVGVHIGHGMVRLLEDAELREKLLADPDLLPGAVEELLRTATFGGSAHPHYAQDDIEVGEVTIRRGDLVMLDFALANFDERVFDDPGRVDFDRAPNPHVAFAHGAWHCLGAPLARIELQEAFRTLLTRLPTLRLTVALAELNNPDGANRLSGALTTVPVTW